MQITKSEMNELATLVATAVVEALEKRSSTPIPVSNKSAYAKTEALLYNYNNFKRIIKERELEIETIKRYGVPKKSASIVEYAPHTGTVEGLTLDEESVDAAVRNVQASVEGTVQAITMIDKAMDALKHDPYYCVVEQVYFEGRTQEDIATQMGCSQVTISKNKSRLVKELSIRLFPNQAIAEMMH